MHLAFEYVPLVLFFAVYKFFDIYWATASLIITSALHILYFIIKKEKVPTKNWAFFALLAVFGGLTIFFHDDTFLKWKVTIINGIFAMVLIISQYVFNKNLIKQFLGESISLPDLIWAKLNLSWAVFFTFCAILNIYIAFNFSQDVWVNFKVFGLMGLTLLFTVISIMSIFKYMPKEDNNSPSDTTQ